MIYTLSGPQHIDTTIQLPASKSISNRALIIQALANGNLVPRHLSDCDDTKVIIEALKTKSETIDIKAAGTAMRFLTAYLSVRKGEHVLTGTDRMKQRPIGVLVDALRYLGADIQYEGEAGYPPLRIKGHPLAGGFIEIPGNVSSQFISALLLIGPMLEKGLELKLTDEIISRPYIDLTLCMMRDFGAIADWTDVDTIRVAAKAYSARDYYIESDWTASSYWYEIMALADDSEAVVRLEGLMDGSKQGDSVVKYIFSLLGIKTSFETTAPGVPNIVTLHRHKCLLPRLEYDFTGSPDLAQTVVVTCVNMNIKFHFKGLSTLRIKETDRIEALKTELRKLGFVLQSVGDDELLWDGERCQPSDEPIETYEDHRMALAFAPVALKRQGLQINNPEVVSKSYPDYWKDLQTAGFTL